MAHGGRIASRSRLSRVRSSASRSSAHVAFDASLPQPRPPYFDVSSVIGAAAGLTIKDLLQQFAVSLKLKALLEKLVGRDAPGLKLRRF